MLGNNALAVRRTGSLSHSFLADVIPLLTADEAAKFDDDAGRRAYANVFNKLIQLMPGKAWASTPRMIEEFGLQDLITA